MAEPLKATFFTLKHRDRAVLLPATLVMIVLVALIVAAWAALNWRMFALMFELTQLGSGQANEEQALAMFSGMMGLFLSTFLLLIPLYIVVAAYEAACLRWMIRGEAPGLFGLTLNNDTWRVWGVYWCWLVTNLAISMVAGMLMMPLTFMMMGDIIAQAPKEPDPAMMWNLQLKLQALSLIQYIPMIFIGVRFGPAAATSIARRRFSFFEAWTVTSERFWALLGSFAVLWLIAGAAMIAAAVPLTLRMWPYFEAMWREPSDATMQAYFQAYLVPENLMWAGAGYVVVVVAWLWLSLMSFGVNARAALAALEEGKIQETAPET
jgi:hypothetical protein